VLLKVQNDSIEGLPFDVALEPLRDQQRPLTLTFSREPPANWAATRDAKAACRAGDAALKRGEWAAALELYDTAAASFAAAGDAARAALTRCSWAGLALVQQGKHAEARLRFEAGVAALTEALGPAHEETLMARLMATMARLELGNGMLAQEELGAAHVEIEAAAAGLEAALGSAHAHTLAARDSLAILLERAGDHAAAAAAFEQAVKGKTQAHGAGHSDTLLSQAKWAKNLTHSGRAAEALPLLEAAAPALAAQLGAEHEWVAFAQEMLAFTRRQLGR
jgi:tetratricopeptide (TPR) repeat protein